MKTCLAAPHVLFNVFAVLIDVLRIIFSMPECMLYVDNNNARTPQMNSFSSSLCCLMYVAISFRHCFTVLISSSFICPSTALKKQCPSPRTCRAQVFTRAHYDNAAHYHNTCCTRRPKGFNCALMLSRSVLSNSSFPCCAFVLWHSAS